MQCSPWLRRKFAGTHRGRDRRDWQRQRTVPCQRSRRAESLTIEKLVRVPAADGVGCERSDELEGVDLARFAEQSLCERRRLDALALSAFSETPSSVIVKIDRAFIVRIGTTPASLTIVASIRQLASDLGLAVVAEGVETEFQRGEIAALGCEYAQGYLYARPMPADAIPAYLARGRPHVLQAVRHDRGT